MMEYSREKFCLYVIGRMCELIQGHTVKSKLLSRDEYVHLFRGMTTGYFKYSPHIAGHIDMEKERKEIWPEVEKVMDEQLEKARHKCLEKSIVTTAMRSILEPRMKESGLEYTAKYNRKGVIVRIRINSVRMLEANIKYHQVQEP